MVERISGGSWLKRSTCLGVLPRFERFSQSPADGKWARTHLTGSTVAVGASSISILSPESSNGAVSRL